MKNYANLHGNSSIQRYLIDNDYVVVEFNDFSQYKYSYVSVGIANIEEMKRLAVRGWGLNSFIRRYVKTSYESRLN